MVVAEAQCETDANALMPVAVSDNDVGVGVRRVGVIRIGTGAERGKRKPNVRNATPFEDRVFDVCEQMPRTPSRDREESIKGL